MKPFTSLELDQMLAALRAQGRNQEKASKAIRAEHVEATRSAINKIQALRAKVVKS